MCTCQKSTKQSNTNILFTCRKLKQISYSDSTFNLPNYVIMSKEKIPKNLIEKTNCTALFRKPKYATKRYLPSVICEGRIIQLKKKEIITRENKTTNQRNSDRFHTEIKIVTKQIFQQNSLKNEIQDINLFENRKR